jgi:hypothetical protein
MYVPAMERLGSAPWRLESFGRLRELGDALDALPPAVRTEDGLPAVTA